jgi:hypothetical protein
LKENGGTVPQTESPPPSQEDEGEPRVKISGPSVMWMMRRPTMNAQKTPAMGRNNEEFADLKVKIE